MGQEMPSDANKHLMFLFVVVASPFVVCCCTHDQFIFVF